MELWAKFKEYVIVEGHVEYLIEVKDSKNSEIWTFNRRYSAMRTWHDSVKPQLESLPKFPPKKYFGNLSHNFIEKRKALLENYFNTLLEMMEHPLVREFIRPRDVVLTMEQQASIIAQESKLDHSRNIEYLEVSGNCIEKMIDLSDINSNSHETKQALVKLLPSFNSPVFPSYLPKGSDENAANSFYNNISEAHWAKKNLKIRVQEIPKNLSDLLILNYF